MKFAIVTAALLGFVIAPSNKLGAQIATRLGVAAGVGVPVGRQSDVVSHGAGGMILVAIGANTSPLGIRADVSSYRLQGRTIAGNKLDDSNFISATLNIVATTTLFRYVKPYGLGGIGWYPIKQGTERKNKAGVNAGVGLTFPAFGKAAFLETRYHRVYSGGSGHRLIPITMGMLF